MSDGSPFSPEYSEIGSGGSIFGLGLILEARRRSSRKRSTLVVTDGRSVTFIVCEKDRSEGHEVREEIAIGPVRRNEILIVCSWSSVTPKQRRSHNYGALGIARRYYLSGTRDPFRAKWRSENASRTRLSVQHCGLS